MKLIVPAHPCLLQITHGDSRGPTSMTTLSSGCTSPISSCGPTLCFLSVSVSAVGPQDVGIGVYGCLLYSMC